MAHAALTILIAASLVLSCLYLHYAVLKWCARTVDEAERLTHRPMLFVLMVVFATHLGGVLLFALVYYVMHWSSWLGDLRAIGEGNVAGFVHYFYYSISTYTTLGAGDILPTGPIRIVTGIEALLGLVLIAWSASFSYLMMERLWTDDGEAE